jgi:two-component sensor histidine kinase
LQQKRDQVLDTITHEGVLVSTAVSFSRPTGWSVALGVPKADMQTPFRLALLGILGVGAASAVVGLWAAWRLAKRVLEADHQRDLLVNELNHRVKNSLASLQAIANQTMRCASTKEEGAKSLEGRIMAMARTHDLLTAANWDSAGLTAIVRQATAPFCRPEALTIEGPEAKLAPQTALSLAMILNELATNAVKYGALSAGGRLRIAWQASQDDIHLYRRGAQPQRLWHSLHRTHCASEKRDAFPARGTRVYVDLYRAARLTGKVLL